MAIIRVGSALRDLRAKFPLSRSPRRSSGHQPGRNADRATDDRDPFKQLPHPPTAGRWIRLAGPGPDLRPPPEHPKSLYTITPRPILSLGLGRREKINGPWRGRPMKTRDRGTSCITRQLPPVTPHSQIPAPWLYKGVVGQGSEDRDVCEGSSDRSPRYCRLNVPRSTLNHQRYEYTELLYRAASSREPVRRSRTTVLPDSPPKRQAIG